MKVRFLLIIAVMITTSLACQVLSGGDGNTGDPNVLFQDDFSDDSSGWDQLDDDSGVTNYSDGVYRIYVNDTNTDMWANPGLSFTDVSMEVDATKIGGPDDNDFGLICRSEDINHFYFFIISSDGYYGIGKISGEDQSLIGMESMEPSDSINMGEASNHLRADCVGDTLTLFVNGDQVASVTDSEYTSGDVGLMAGTFSEPGADIQFDNFIVRKP